MSIKYSDKEAIIRKVSEALTSFHTFNIGDRAIVIDEAHSNLKRFDIATITHKHHDTALVVTARGFDGTERKGTVRPEQLLPADPIGEDIDGNTVHMHDFVEGVDECKGELLMVAGINEDGEAISHAVKIRMKPTIETHVNTIVSLENTRLSTLEEWSKPRAGDVVEFTEVAFDEFGDVYANRGDYAVYADKDGEYERILLLLYGLVKYEYPSPIKTVLRK